MTKLASTPADAMLVAIDMSEHRQEALIERPEGGGRRRMTVMATKTDFDRLAADLADIGRPVANASSGKRVDVPEQSQLASLL